MSTQIEVTMRDGQTHTVDVINPDRVRWDRTAHRHQWPKFSEVPFWGMTFWAYAAMTRLGLYTDTWEQFSDHDCLDVRGEEEHEDDAPELDPTRPTAPLEP